MPSFDEKLDLLNDKVDRLLSEWAVFKASRKGVQKKLAKSGDPRVGHFIGWWVRQALEIRKQRPVISPTHYKMIKSLLTSLPADENGLEEAMRMGAKYWHILQQPNSSGYEDRRIQSSNGDLSAFVACANYLRGLDL